MYNTQGIGGLEERLEDSIRRVRSLNSDADTPCNCPVRPNVRDKFNNKRTLVVDGVKYRTRSYHCPNCLSNWDVVEIPISFVKRVSRLPKLQRGRPSSLSRDERIQILKKLHSGQSPKSICQEHNIWQSILSKAKRRLTWTDISPEEYL